MRLHYDELGFAAAPSSLNWNSRVGCKRQGHLLSTRSPKSAEKKKRLSITLCIQKETQSTQRMDNAPLLRNMTRKLFGGFDPSPELSAILLVYFVQGALGISRLAISFFLKDELHLSPAECAALTGASAIPWLIKPIYGFLSDSLPLLGYRRRSYLIGAGAIGVASWAWLATSVDSAFTAFLACLLTSLSVAISDVVVDSIVVERVRDLPPEKSGSLQSLCWGASAFGGLLSAYFSGSLLQTLRPRDIFALTAVLPLGTSLLAGMIKEKSARFPHLSNILPDARARTGTLITALRNPSVYLPVAFIFSWQAMPSPESALFFFSTNVLGFGPEFLGRVRLVSSCAALVGLWVYRTFLRDVQLKRFFFWATLVSVPLSLTQVILVTRLNIPLGISDQLFSLTDSAVLTALGQIVFMPTLVLAARLCPPGIEGTLFATLMSIYNASGVTSTELGAIMTKILGVTDTNFDNLWLLVVICSFSNLLALPLVGLVDRIDTDNIVQNDQQALGDEERSMAITQTAPVKIRGYQPESQTQPEDLP